MRNGIYSYNKVKYLPGMFYHLSNGSNQRMYLSWLVQVEVICVALSIIYFGEGWPHKAGPGCLSFRYIHFLCNCVIVVVFGFSIFMFRRICAYQQRSTYFARIFQKQIAFIFAESRADVVFSLQIYEIRLILLALQYIDAYRSCEKWTGSRKQKRLYLSHFTIAIHKIYKLNANKVYMTVLCEPPYFLKSLEIIRFSTFYFASHGPTTPNNK